MKIFFKILFWIFWLSLGFILHCTFISYFEDKDTRAGLSVLLVFWWGITIIIFAALIKLKQYRKVHPALTKEQKQKIKQMRDEEKYRNSAEYKKKYVSEVEIENSYFGNGVLLKNSEDPENVCYTDIDSGFDRIFDSFGKKSDTPCDLYEFIVKEDNIQYVLSSLEKIYKNSDQIMEKCYDELYKEIVHFFEDVCEWDVSLKKEFNLEYLKKNWCIYGLDIDDDGIGFSIGINASDQKEANSYFSIIISVAYSTLEPEVSFNVVW